MVVVVDIKHQMVLAVGPAAVAGLLMVLAVLKLQAKGPAVDRLIMAPQVEAVVDPLLRVLEAMAEMVASAVPVLLILFLGHQLFMALAAAAVVTTVVELAEQMEAVVETLAPEQTEHWVPAVAAQPTMDQLRIGMGEMAVMVGLFIDTLRGPGLLVVAR